MVMLLFFIFGFIGIGIMYFVVCVEVKCVNENFFCVNVLVDREYMVWLFVLVIDKFI